MVPVRPLSGALPLSEATSELKVVRPELYAEAEVFFG